MYFGTIYNKGQVFIGNPRLIYGSDNIVMYKPIRNQKSAFSYAYPMKQIRWKMRNQEKLPCDDENTEGNTTECIMDFLKRTIGCSMILQGRNRQLDLYCSKTVSHSFVLNLPNFRCDEPDQVIEYGAWGGVLQKSNETQIFKMTGCIPTCDRYEYGFHPMIANQEPAEVDSLTLQFVFTSGRHELREQARYATLKV